MNDKVVEVEIRAEIKRGDEEEFKRRIGKIGTLHSHTKRLSVMFFGRAGTKETDVRVRVTNGKCEVVVKLGSFGSHDRIEMAQKISSSQFLGFVRIFSRFGFAMEVGERENFNYRLRNSVLVSLVSAGTISYVELEKISSQSEAKQSNQLLRKLAEELGLQVLELKQFDELCGRLAEGVDWPFHDTEGEYAKLVKLLSRYTKKKKRPSEL